MRPLVVVLFLASTIALAAPACGGKRTSATAPPVVENTPGPPADEGTGAAVGGRDIEARVSVQRLYDGARAYYLEEAADRSGLVIAKQFPVTASTDTAPPVGSCCDQPDRKCRPEPSLWDDATWWALKFSMDDPHYYSYRYVSDGKSFTAQAIGDLDCDGVYATYELSGAATPDGNVAGPREIKVTNGDE